MEKLPNHGKHGLEEFKQGQTSSNRKCFGPKSNPKVTVGKNGILEGGREYYNPDPLYWLIGPANETEVNVEEEAERRRKERTATLEEAKHEQAELLKKIQGQKQKGMESAEVTNKTDEGDSSQAGETSDRVTSTPK